MKAYTDLGQSKKLAEILPIESADIYYFGIDDYPNSSKRYHEILIGKIDKDDIDDFGHIPCWSLSALLDYIKDKCGYFELVYLSSTFDGRANKLENVYRLSTDVYDVYEKEVIDACVEMILKLHKQKIL